MVPITQASRLRRSAFAGLLAAALFAGSTGVAAADPTEQENLVDKARITFESFVSDPNMAWFHEHVKEAKAVLIVPQLLKAGFFVGVSGGSGVVLARDEGRGEWSEPAFYTLGSGSFGLQIGAQASEYALLVMTKKGVESLLGSTFTLGADATVAVGPVGAGVEAATAINLSADILSFARSKGLFAGVSLEGAVIAVRDESNNTYYGKDVRPVDILMRRDVSNSHSARLRAALTKASGGK